jgi:WD40 repeat protein
MVTAVAFSPDGGYLAYGDQGGKLRLYRTETREEQWSQPANAKYLGALAFSRDGSRLYAGSGSIWNANPSQKDWAIRIWDVAAGKVMGDLLGHTAPVHCLAVSPDGKRLLSGAGDHKNRDSTVRLWDLGSGKELKRLGGDTCSVRGVAFAPDGKRAVSVSEDRTRLWNLEAPSEKGRNLGHRGYPRAVVFVSTDRFVTAGDDRKLTVWDLDGNIINERQLPHRVTGLALSQNGKYLATANSNGTVYVLRLPLRER